MIKLTVSNFSCIETADFEIGGVTLLIGPQASGKSVLCKLVYFCLNSFFVEPWDATNRASYDAFTKTTRKRFYEWFPLSAWGQRQFSIELTIGTFRLKIARTIYNNSPTDNIRITTSPAVRAYFSELERLAEKIERTSKQSDELPFDQAWKFYTNARGTLRKHLADDYVQSQLFIPAGRSFFTSVGKAFAAFEQGGLLDPLILRFGRSYAQLRDTSHMVWRSARRSEDIHQALNQIFGGEIIEEDGRELVLTEDGRKIPFAALSSGQQELLPLVTVLPEMSEQTEERSLLVYIEEPEAHLFPKSQSRLIEVLAAITFRPKASIRMVLTTHSPYVPAKFNNLIKAGQLYKRYRKKEKKQKIRRIVPLDSQIPANSVHAYAIKDGQLVNIVDNDGLIDAEYLDDVSGDIAKEFSNLLSVEYEQ